MLYFRADMNPVIATGHVMRCISIADAAKRMGEESTFIIADQYGRDFIESRGHHVIVLDSPWDALEKELPKLIELIHTNHITSILVDSYYVTEKYLSTLREYVYTIYLDDLNLFHYSVHGILCYASYYKEYQYDTKYPDTDLWLGTKYAPLRVEFEHCPAKCVQDKVNSILVMSGGTDQYGVLKNILAELVAWDIKDIYIICGMYYEEYDLLVNQYKENKAVHILKAVSNLKDYMEQVDVVISAAGSTLYELCATGTPTISFTFADNQLSNAIQFEKDGIIPYAGDARDGGLTEKMKDKLLMFMNDFELRKTVSCKMQKLVDGKGASRIAEKLMKVGER